MVCGSFQNLASNSGECGLGRVKQPFDYALYTPFVELMYRGKYYTVGNEGARNQAVIEAFHLNIIGGNSDGAFSGTITIVTCDYGDVKELLGLIPQSECKYDEYYLSDSGEGIEGYINIGWIFNSCDGDGGYSTRTDNATESASAIFESDDIDIEDIGPYIYGIFKTGSFHFEEGYYKIELNFTSVAESLDLFRNEAIQGQDDQKQLLWPSLRTLVGKRCDETDANFDLTKLRLSTDNKSFETWKFSPSDGGMDGPYGVWGPNQLNPVDGSRAILMSFVTEKDKGMFYVFPNQTKRPTLMVFEDHDPNVCLNEKRTCPFTTYIVNAGDCTPVLKFTPEYNSQSLVQEGSEENDFDAVHLAGRGGGGPNAFSTIPERVNVCEVKLDEQTGNQENTQNQSSNGRQIEIPTNSEDLNHRPPSLISSKLISAVSTNLSSSDSSEAMPIVRATMEIIGDPYYTGILNVIQDMYVQIIFINPFCIKQNGQNGDCEYLAEPPVNDILSGFYRISGASHNITKGSFITTLQLQRMALDEDFLG